MIILLNFTSTYEYSTERFVLFLIGRDSESAAVICVLCSWMEVTILSRKWRWLLQTANESSRRSVTIAVTDGVASGAGPNLRELVSDRLFFLPGSKFKLISITFSTTHWRLRFHSSLRRLHDFFNRYSGLICCILSRCQGEVLLRVWIRHKIMNYLLLSDSY